MGSGNLLETVRRSLGIKEMSKVNWSSNLAELGMDSMLGAEFRKMLSGNWTMEQVLQLSLKDVQALDGDSASSHAHSSPFTNGGGAKNGNGYGGGATNGNGHGHTQNGGGATNGNGYLNGGSEKNGNGGPESGSRLLHSVARSLGIKNLAKVNTSCTLADLGMDSMLGAELRKVVEADYNTRLSMEQVLQLTLTHVIHLEKTGTVPSLGLGNGNGFVKA